MIVSSPKAIDNQSLLWKDAREFNIRTPAQTRNICGEFFEHATQALTGAVRHRTDATADICPDLSAKSSVFFESKSIGTSGRSILYVRRIEKDQRFVDETKFPLYYFLWHHRAKATKAANTEILKSMLAMTLCHCTVIPFHLVRDIAAQYPVKMLNKVYSLQQRKSKKATGYNTEMYGTGWSVPLTAFEAACDLHYVQPGVTINGVQTCDFTVRTVRPATAHLIHYTLPAPLLPGFEATR